MADRYGAIREALPILIAEAQAKGGRNERAALIVELLAERDALARRVEWQPIETAPKDGVEFLSVANYTDEPRQVQIVDWDFVQQCQPGLYTHWMPLPEPPQEDRNG